MTWTKGRIAVAAATALAVAIAVAVMVKVERRRHSAWDVLRPDLALLQKTPPQVRLVPTKFVWGGGWVMDGDKMIGIGVQLRSIVQTAYRVPGARVVVATALPPFRYDFIANLKKGSLEALQQEIKRETGVVARRETRETDVLVLTVRYANGRDLKPSDETSSPQTQYQDGEYFWSHQPLSTLAQMLEQKLDSPVVDETNLAGDFDFHLKWNWRGSPDALKRDLSEQLGLALAPARRSIEVLVIDRAHN